MKLLDLLLCSCLLIFPWGVRCFAQVETSDRIPDEDVVPYNMDAIAFASLTSPGSRLDVFVQVPFERLSFVKVDETYAASYELSITLFDSAGRLVQEKLWTENVKATSFNESVSSQSYSLTQRSFEVPPGRFGIVTILRDNETKTSQRLTRQILVSDFFSDMFSLSDIMLVGKLVITGGKRSIVPSVSSNVSGLPEAVHLFFEAYNWENVDSVRYVVSVFNTKNEPQFESEYVHAVDSGRNQVFLSVDHTKLPLGDYLVYVRAAALNLKPDSSVFLATTSRAFVVRWRGMPRSVKDLDLAIDQVQYIAKEKELAYMKGGTTLEERQKRFLEFWTQHDPNPNTPRNEKMEEYYARVEYANRTFKHYVDGWRTDMGMVYIIFGPPNNVDRHPMEVDSKPYEVWSYYEINHRFTFIDNSGFGDYRLTTPIWEVWQRPRD